MTTLARRWSLRAIRRAILACAFLSGACGSAVFRPARPQPVTVPGAVATVTSLKLRSDMGLLVTTSWQAGQEIGVRSVQIAPQREVACGSDLLGRPSVLRVAGQVRWDRPLPLTPSGATILELELPNPARALATDSALDFDLGTPANPLCARLPLFNRTDPGWTLATTGALGVGVQLDEMGRTGFLRPGVWVGSYRHGVQIGFGDSHGVDGRRAVLPFGPMLALGWTTERLWSLPIGFYAVSLVVGYQARALIEAPAAGEPRIAHGPQVIVRPFTFVAVHPPQLPVGGRLGYLSVIEFIVSYWLSGDGQTRAGTLGIGFTWDRPLARY